MNPKLYEFTLHDPENEMLQFLINEAGRHAEASPAFFGALISACREELELCAHKETRHAKLSIPWILEDQGAYMAACTFCTNVQLVALRNTNVILRNLMGVLIEVLINQQDQGLGEDVPKVH